MWRSIDLAKFAHCIVVASALIGVGSVVEVLSYDHPYHQIEETSQVRCLTDLSLEELMDLEMTVTSVSRRPEKLSEASAAIYVITSEDIRRSGATSIPELLRMAPGMQVGRIDASKWAISARGFADRISNKLLVMIDGRTVYTPTFSGTIWSYQDTLLEDIDRIEVIRGPGATLWGANAVNGIINIITKDARETQGGLFSGTAGDEEIVSGARYGGVIDEQAHYRAYGKFREHDSFTSDSPGFTDEWNQSRAGFRIDWDRSLSKFITLQGDVYDGREMQSYEMNILEPPFRTSVSHLMDIGGSNILARWSHCDDISTMAVQMYYDYHYMNMLGKESRKTFDIDFQHSFDIGDKHSVIWGAAYRRSSDSNHNQTTQFQHKELTNRLASFFIQDNVVLVPEYSHLTVGSKFENHTYTGWEIQPTVRMLLTPNSDETYWAAVSRAVRTPSRFERDVQIGLGIGTLENGLPYQTRVNGSENYDSEDLLAYEIGYRVQKSRRFSLDLAAFYNTYDNFRSIEMGEPTLEPATVPYVVVPLYFDNNLKARTYGAEIVASWDVNDSWTLSGHYSWLNVDVEPDGVSTDMMSSSYERLSPTNQFHIRSFLDISRDLEFDALLYYVDGIASPSVPEATPDIPSYLRLDLRLGWRLRPDIDFNVGVQNLFDDQHREFGRTLGEIPSEVGRNIYGKLTWHF